MDINQSPLKIIEAAKVSKMLNIERGVEQCKELLENCTLDISRIGCTLKAAKYLKMEKVRNKCFELINSLPQSEFFDKLDPKEIERKELIDVLEHRSTTNGSELHAFEFAVRWLHSRDDRHRSLLSSIDVLSLTCDEFMGVIEKFPTFFTWKEAMSILCNIRRKSLVALPPWCIDSSIASDSSYDTIKQTSLKLEAQLQKPALRPLFFGEDGFHACTTFELKLPSRFPKEQNLKMFELAFGSDYVPKEHLELDLQFYDQCSTNKKRKNDFKLQETGENYYLVLTRSINLTSMRPLVFYLQLSAKGLRKWGTSEPVSNLRYRVAEVPENVFCNMCLNNQNRLEACLTPLNEWLILLDPKQTERKPIITSFYFT